jgi:hypothetical protein
MSARRFGALLSGNVGTDAVMCCVVTSCLFATCAVVRHARLGSPSPSDGRVALVEDVMAVFACLAGALTLAKVAALVQVLGQAQLPLTQQHMVLSSEPARPDVGRLKVRAPAWPPECAPDCAPACAPVPRRRITGARGSRGCGLALAGARE